MAVGLSILLWTIFLLSAVSSDILPTSYEHYTSGGISSGLSVDQSYFTLNGRNISIYSGALHYFRVPRGHWRNGLRKIRAAGLNTVETYIAWNLHEPESGVYDFGDGGSEMEDFLHIEEFVKTAQEEDLFVILRPGPYICAEYNFGGFPSWLLREKEIGFRTSEKTYIHYVERYFNALLPILAKYQFTKGGSIIAFQLENEYGFSPDPQKEYIEDLYNFYIQNDIVELLFTSDPPTMGLKGTLPGILFHTMNFGDSPEQYFDTLLELQPNKPVMAMEFWSGWFDFWGDPHNTRDAVTFRDNYERILKYPGSVNIYTFHGGTNFGFSNGASLVNSALDNSGFDPITTSYDYDSPLTEAGDYTDKYYYIKELLEQYNPVKTYTPDLPELIPRVAYPTITIDKQILLKDVIKYNAPYVIESEDVVAMEMLDINHQSGQSNGYIVYRKENVNLEEYTLLEIQGHVCDTAMVLVDGVLVSPVLTSAADFNKFGYWKLTNSMLVINKESKENATVDIIVEEWGRMNGGTLQQYNQTFKGLWQGHIYLNGEKVSDWQIVPLEFKKDWTNGLENWSAKTTSNGPTLYLAELEISDEPRDTYLDMRKWSKGLVSVNGFPLGKYLKLGPQQTLYLPAPFLKKGSNKIVIFEHFEAADELTFVTDAIWAIA